MHWYRGELLATLAAATLTGIACCGPVVIQWLGFLVGAVGGRVLLRRRPASWKIRRDQEGESWTQISRRSR